MTPDPAQPAFSEPEKSDRYKPELYFKRNMEEIETYSFKQKQKKLGAESVLKAVKGMLDDMPKTATQKARAPSCPRTANVCWMTKPWVSWSC